MHRPHPCPASRSIPAGTTASTPLSAEALDAIHLATFDLLATTGIWVGSAELLAVAADSGLACADSRVRFSPEDIDQALAKAGREVVLLARDPAKSVTLRQGASLIGMGRSAPFITLPGGRQRPATGADYIEFTKLGQMLPEIELPGQLAFPGDISADKVYRFMMVNQIRFSDKPFCLLHEEDLDLLCQAFAISRQSLADGPDKGVAWAQTTVNTHSPLAISKDQGDYLLVMARNGIPISISPTPAAGSSGPCSLVGNLVLNNAEVLATLVLSQVVRPGLAVLYGAFPCASDMRSMMATYGGPETRKMEAAASQLASRYGLLSRGNVCISDAQEIDFQAGAESLFNLISALTSGISFLPGCGIAGGFASASREKLILDSDLVAAARHYLKPIALDGLAEVIALIKEIGPKGNFITAPHTFSTFKKELFHPTVMARMSQEKWVDRNETISQQAARRADRLLQSYTRPELDPGLEKYLENLL